MITATEILLGKPPLELYGNRVHTVMLVLVKAKVMMVHL